MEELLKMLAADLEQITAQIEKQETIVKEAQERKKSDEQIIEEGARRIEELKKSQASMAQKVESIRQYRSVFTESALRTFTAIQEAERLEEALDAYASFLSFMQVQIPGETPPQAAARTG